MCREMRYREPEHIPVYTSHVILSRMGEPQIEAFDMS